MLYSFLTLSCNLLIIILMKKNSVFEKPIITRIKLDPEQAVMQACIISVGGQTAWVNSNHVCWRGATVGTSNANCTSGYRQQMCNPASTGPNYSAGS